MAARAGRAPSRNDAKAAKEKEDAAAAAAAAAVMDSGERRTMLDACKALRVQIKQEKQLLNEFQQQRERVEKFWLLEKKKREDMKMDLRNKIRQRQDLEEKHAFELKVYKQKIAHLQHEIQGATTNVKIDAERQMKLLQEENRDLAHDLQTNTRTIKVLKKEYELAHIDIQKANKQTEGIRVSALRHEFERAAEELKASYARKLTLVRKKYGDIRRREVAVIEQRKNEHIAALIERHKRSFEDIKTYYHEITQNNIEQIIQLKAQLTDMKNHERENVTNVNKYTREHRRLFQPLLETKAEVARLTHELEVYEEEKVALSGAKKSLAALEEQYKNKQWEHEILQQRAAHLREEKTELQNKLERTIYDVQQKSGFKNLLLERKYEAMSQDLEKTQAALAEVLASTNLQPDLLGQIEHSLEDVLMAKNKTVMQLQHELQNLKHKYATTIRVYDAKLKEYEIPKAELGFQPVKRF